MSRQHAQLPVSSPRLLASAIGVAITAGSAGHMVFAAEKTDSKASGNAIALDATAITGEAQDPTSYQVEKASSPKYTAPLVDTPRSVTVIPQQVLKDTGALNMQDALRTVPGITFGAGEGGNPQGDRPFIRGFDAQGDTYLDGVRDTGSQSREIFAVENIEVSKGPNSAIGGRGAAGDLARLAQARRRRPAGPVRLPRPRLPRDQPRRRRLLPAVRAHAQARRRHSRGQTSLSSPVADVRFTDTDRPAPRLSRDLVQALERDTPEQLAAPAFAVAWRGLLTAGLWPAWKLNATLDKAVRWRRNLADHVAEWAVLNVGDAEARAIRRANAPRAELLLAQVGRGAAVVALLSAAWVVVDTPDRFQLLWFVDPFRGAYPTLAQATFLGGLGVAYLLNWLGANLHLSRGRRLARAVVEATDDATVTPPRLPKWEWGLRVVPLVAAGVLSAWGMLWAAPMFVAASALRRTTLAHDRRLLDFLAARCRTGVSRQKPDVDLAPPLGRILDCPNPGCGAHVRQQTGFCPRCGHAIRRRGDLVE